MATDPVITELSLLLDESDLYITHLCLFALVWHCATANAACQADVLLRMVDCRERSTGSVSSWHNDIEVGQPQFPLSVVTCLFLILVRSPFRSWVFQDPRRNPPDPELCEAFWSFEAQFTNSAIQVGANSKVLSRWPNIAASSLVWRLESGAYLAIPKMLTSLPGSYLSRLCI